MIQHYIHPVHQQCIAIDAEAATQPEFDLAPWVAVSALDAEYFLSKWHAPTPQQAARNELLALEATITPRRLREATLTDEGKQWLIAVDARIAELRESL